MNEITQEQKKQIYLDANVPSYYFDERESIATLTAATRTWWDEQSDNYELFISEVGYQELKRGNYEHQAEVLELISAITLLPWEPKIKEISLVYVEQFVMPKSVAGDAGHLAYASYYDMDYLLTWNCKHLANPNKEKHIQVVNKRLHLSTPQLVTPLELLNMEE